MGKLTIHEPDTDKSSTVNVKCDVQSTYVFLFLLLQKMSRNGLLVNLFATYCVTKYEYLSVPIIGTNLEPLLNFTGSSLIDVGYCEVQSFF